MNVKSLVLGITLVSAIALTSALPTSASPSPVTENGQGTLLVVGDSLTVGTDYFGSLKTKIDQLHIWPTTMVDAKVGRLATEGASIVEKKITASTTAIVIALGTNDMISRRDPDYPPTAIDAVMVQTEGLPVLWCNVKFSPTGRGDWRFRGRRFNRALRDAQTRWPNLVIADWDKSFTPSGKNRYIADGVHLSVSAYKTRAAFFVKQLKSFGAATVNATSTTSTTTLPTTTTTTSAPTTTTSAIAATTTTQATTTTTTTP